MSLEDIDTVMVHVVAHPGFRGTYVVQATLYDGAEYEQDDAEEIRGLRSALSYAVNSANYYQQEHPRASVAVYDPAGNEFWPIRFGAKKRGSRKPKKRGSRRPRR